MKSYRTKDLIDAMPEVYRGGMLNKTFLSGLSRGVFWLGNRIHWSLNSDFMVDKDIEALATLAFNHEAICNNEGLL